MKTNKETVYEYIEKNCGTHSKSDLNGFTTQYLSEKLGLQRSNVSAMLNELVSEGKIEKLTGRPVLYRLFNIDDSKNEVSCFRKLIGHDGSLKTAVQLAKAAILYPVSGLHPLIIAPMGAGKSYFAHLMHQFAIETKIIKSSAKFTHFDCSSYADNYDLLYKELFDIHTNDGTKFNKSISGFLFIDHIELLQADIRSKLFALMEHKDTLNIFILCATAEDINLSTMNILKDKFAIRIELASLDKRGISERMELVKLFFNKEVLKTKLQISINAELLRCLLLYNLEYNIKQLESDIKIGCANAYVRQLSSNTNKLNVYMNDLPNYVRKGFLYYKKYKEEIERIIPNDFAYKFTNSEMETVSHTNKVNLHKTIYEEIEHKITDLKMRGITQEDINTIVSVDIDKGFKNYKERLVNRDIDKSKLEKIVDSKIILMVEEFLKQATLKFDRDFSVSIFYGLCLHINSMLLSGERKQKLPNIHILEIIDNYKEEYKMSVNFSTKIEIEFDLKLPIDEVIFIAMFICDKDSENIPDSKPNVIVAMHGNSTASSIKEVINSLVNGNNVYAYDLCLENDMKQSYDDLKNLFVEVDNGKGIIFIYDMGSLKSMAEMISQETSIKIKLIEVPITLIGIECARKCLTEKSVDDIHDSVMTSYHTTLDIIKQNYKKDKSQKLIITLCMSGEGAALQTKNFIKDNLNLKDVEIIALATSDRSFLLKQINKYGEKYQILCIVGSYDPLIEGFKFVTISKIFNCDTSKLGDILGLSQDSFETDVNYDGVYNYLKEQLENINIDKLKATLPKTIKEIKNQICTLSQDQELGLFLHIACNIHRSVENLELPKNIRKDKIINEHQNEFKKLKMIMKLIENEFDIVFWDDEYANIISIIKKL